MKKIVSLLITLSLLLTFFAGCTNNSQNDTPSAETETEAEAGQETGIIKIGASITPHAEILEVAAELLVEEGYELDIVEYTDYVQPNIALDEGDLDANFFQHQPYLDEFNVEYGTKIVTVAKIHYEPFGLYAGKLASLDDIANGSTVAIPNDGTNEARALLLLEDLGYITLKADIGLSATILDIEENSLNLDIIEMEAAQISNAIPDVDFVILNGNYALQAGLVVGTDALATEEEGSLAYDTYPNILCVQEGRENDPSIQALVKALTSEEVREYINNTYEGSVIPVF